MQDLEDKGFSCDKLCVEFYNQEYQNYKSGTSFAELMAQSYTSWADSTKFFMGIWAFGISAERCKSLSKWDYTDGYKLSLEEETMLKHSTVDFQPLEISDKDMYQLGDHYNKHGKIEMGYNSKAEYDAAAKEFAYNNQRNPDSKIYQGVWGGKGKLHGSIQRAIIYNDITVIINIKNGQIIDFYKGSQLKGLIKLRQLQ